MLHLIPEPRTAARRATGSRRSAGGLKPPPRGADGPAAARPATPPPVPAMFLPEPPADRPAAATPGAGTPPAAAADRPAEALQVFGRDGLVDPAESPAAASATAVEPVAANPLPALLVAAVVTLVLRGFLLLAVVAGLPSSAPDRFLLTVQWIAGGLLVLPVGLCVFRLTARVGPAVAAAAVVALHPGVVSASLEPGGPFWALAAAACGCFLLLGTQRPTGLRPVPGLAPCAAAGLVLGAGGVLALPVAALAAPLALWRLLRGLGCPGPGRGPRDLAAAGVLLAAAAIPLTGLHAADGDSPASRLAQPPRGEAVTRLIEGRWPELLGRFGMRPGVDLLGEVRAAFEPPPADDAVLAAPAPGDAAPTAFDHAAGHAWTALNAALLCGSLAAAGLAFHRRRPSLLVLLAAAVPAAVLTGEASGEAVRLSLLPLQLFLLGAFWLPTRRFRPPSAVFHDPVADAGFTIKQNTPRVI